ncbi:hypothetical protein EDB89DRAFT_2066023 [Lactarius sanguifluus]|nr:hypothetical protein EDB89DRAFT_2066023 [Lactarius sanguifluus]
METKTWLLPVNHTFQTTIGSRFSVLTFGEEDVETLKEKVMEKKQNNPAFTHVSASDLSVWKTKGELVINKVTIKESLVDILSGINIHNKDTIEELDEDEQVADLELSEGQILLVRLPAISSTNYPSSGESLASEVAPKYEDFFIMAETKGEFTEGDFDLNRIKEARQSVPAFVKTHETILARKRKADQTLANTERLVGKMAWKSYFSNARPNFSAGRSEIMHFVHITSVNARSWGMLKEGNRRCFKEADANWLFSYAIVDHVNSLPPNVASESDETKFTVKLGQDPWPLQLIVQVGEEKENHIYTPRSDFLILKFGLPRLAVEVNSHTSHKTDFFRLMLQGTIITRFANTLDMFKNEKNFIFVAIYISATGDADRYLLYQENGSREVFYKKRSFKLSVTDDRMLFVLGLYNLVSALDVETEDEGTKKSVRELAVDLRKLRKDGKLPTFTGKTKNRRSHDGGNQAGPSTHGGGGGGSGSGATEELGAQGYQVVPDIIETDGGTWELIEKLPPHIRTVYRRSDSNKTELIAKHLREGSSELYFLKHLRTMQSQSPHIISFIETIPSITGGWLILPKQHTLRNQRLMNSGGVHVRVQLGWGLIRGLAYLHEHKVAHRDIKPDNLVCDSTFCLQIIDFDVAIEVQDENTEVDEYRGTKGWTAPELGKEDGLTPMHSPIRADRWSCGCVLLRHIMVGKGDKHLSEFAERLMAKDPQLRPSLLEWDKSPITPLSDMIYVHKDGGKESQPQQDMVGVDEECTKPPDAKKLRLTVI